VCGVIRSKVDDSMVLTVQDDKFVLGEYQSECDEQQWRVSAGDSKLQHREKEELVLSIVDGNEESGAEVGPAEDAGEDSQLWTFEYQEPIMCYIRSVYMEDRVIDVEDADADAGTKVQLNKQDDVDKQKWWEDKYGIIHTALNDMVFDTSSDEGKLRIQEYDPDVAGMQWQKSGQRIFNKVEPGRCLQIRDHKDTKLMKKFKVGEDDYSGQPHQKWIFEYM